MVRGSRRAAATVVFDIGGVLIDWNPRHLYRRLFDGDEAAMEGFLSSVCTPEWNAAQDAGRPWADAIEQLCREHSDQRALIEAYDQRWIETVGGVIDGTVEVLADLRARDVPLYALSNWSAEKFALVRDRYEFLRWFDGIVVSGEIGVAKPDRRIYRHLFERYDIEPSRALFVDDNPANIAVGEQFGMPGLLYVDPSHLRADLRARGLIG